MNFWPRKNVRIPGPRRVCLCGSTRFYQQFQEANYRETMAGRIVLSVGFFAHASKEAHGESLGITPGEKLMLDELHKRKIDLSDEILVINVGGYIGESTRSEIEYAKQHSKAVRYLEEKCSFCDSQDRVERAICCHKPVCPSHRYGTGAKDEGFTCQDHPFGKNPAGGA